MNPLHHARRRLRLVVVPAACALIGVYFGYHLVQGDRGLVAWLDLSQRIKRSETRLEVLSAERAERERRVALLRPDSLDRDLLDEQARRLLGVGHADEVVLLRR
ncbi:MAG: septum formation initiator family protein [Alphaproteobacteria bacterium]|nr:septum formation initiator family protein [Alphaproteobacteria bacterium]